ncbi:hypothetical protein R5R35_008490 [Gryllus longicercus]|uniref:Uncharacterized protein n=1 Tax=Gryllus longicercus TaxID=2509291 RepID=A0AAN9YV34_9ORTH
MLCLNQFLLRRCVSKHQQD